MKLRDIYDTTIKQVCYLIYVFIDKNSDSPYPGIEFLLHLKDILRRHISSSGIIEDKTHHVRLKPVNGLNILHTSHSAELNDHRSPLKY